MHADETQMENLFLLSVKICVNLWL